jgi:ribosomal protein S18 acetylase RimI-like enzyme
MIKLGTIIDAKGDPHMTSIRRATPDDVPRLSEVTANAFDGITLDEPYCRDLIAKGEYMVWAAIADNRVVGYAGAFVTMTTGAVRRWELDLLAVHRDYRGSQLGTKLILAADEESKTYKVKFARSLIRVENIASQKAFERAGYKTSGQVYDMLGWEPKASDARFGSGKLIVLLPVETLLYRGVWIEGLDSPLASEADKGQAIEAARAQAAAEQRYNASALVAVDKPLSDNLIADASLQKPHQWWRKP